MRPCVLFNSVISHGYKYFEMNVLILTPDRVGSTFLQRVLTVYMQLHKFDKPVINLHELSNGLEKYYSPVFNQEVLGRPTDQWGYYQTLPELVKMLKSADHYKTSRMAHYHLRARGDSIAHQLELYQYLNENFFIISARRQNLLEHALSWIIETHSNVKNVYSHAEKFDTYLDLYRGKIVADPVTMIKYLDDYRDYVQWCERHFSVGSIFEYEKHMLNIEEYVLNLTPFATKEKVTWKSAFDQEFQEWNRCHYLLSDISGIGSQLPQSQQLLLEYSNAGKSPQGELQSLNSSQLVTALSRQDQEFLINQGPQYKKTCGILNELVENRVMHTGIPIKLQTMLEKKLLIKNFSLCVDVYNQWVYKNNLGVPYTDEQLNMAMIRESGRWHGLTQLADQSSQPHRLQ